MNNIHQGVKTLLGEHIKTQKGFAFKSKWYSDFGTPIVKVSDLTDDSIDTSNLTCIPDDIATSYLKYKLQTGDTIIQTVGSWPRNPKSVVGKVIKVPSNASGALLNQNAVKISPAKTLDRLFMFYLLKSNIFKDFIIGCAQGAANQASITLDDIRKFSFWLSPISTQRKIAAILSAYDDLIENNSRRIKILEEMAQALYREWFVKFRFPGHENVKQVESELGLVPEGWEVKNLFDIADVTYGFPFKSKLFTAEPMGKAVIRIRDLKTNGTKTYTTQETLQKYIVKDGDLLVGMDGDFHMCKWAGDEAYLNQRVVRFRPKYTLPAYCLFLALEKPIHYFDLTIVGTTVAHLSDKNLKSIQLVIPPPHALRFVQDIFDALFDLEINLRIKNTTLRRTRDLLLPKLISGEVDVSNLKIETEALGT